MKTEKRLLKHDFKWVEPFQRKSRLPGNDKPHRIGKPETRKPYLWLIRSLPKMSISDLYLINDSGEVLEEVVSNIYGFLTDDDEIHSFSTKADYTYKDVQPGEAVRVEKYNLMYDSDYVLGLSIQITSKGLGEIEFSNGTKGGINKAIILWDTLETGNNSSIKVPK